MAKHVGLLLDESGSMGIRKKETIKAVNEYFNSLKSEKAKITFATFDSVQNVNFRLDAKPAATVEALTEASYMPNGATPLLDAVGKMISVMQSKAKKNDKVIIMVVTDGEENCSAEFTLEQVKTLIQQCEADNWVFAYIGAAPEAWNGSVILGASLGSTLNTNGAAGDVTVAMAVSSRATRQYFRGQTTAKNFYRKEE